MRHAWLIIAHNNINQLYRLVKFLDHSCNDIYIHMDKKFKDYHYNKLKGMISFANIYEPDERISVTWGGWSQCECELILIQKALQNYREYDYIHLISNGDVPIKSWEYIYHFFESHAGFEFLSYGVLHDRNELFHRCGAFHILQDFCGRNHKILRSIDRVLFRFQRYIGIDRLKNSNCTWFKGSNWFSITGECAEYIFSKREWCKKHFMYSFCCDELMINTIVANSSFSKHVYLNGISGNNDQRSSLRYVDWERGNDNSPHLFTIDDLNKLLSSREDLLFARKFDEKVDNRIIDLNYSSKPDEGTK